MAKIVIRLAQQAEVNDTLTHRFQNFGEAAYAWVAENEFGAVDIRELDRATDQFVINGVKTSKSRRIIGWVQGEAARQFLSITTEVLNP